MTRIVPFAADGRFGPSQKKVLRRAKLLVMGEAPLDFQKAEPGPGVLGFGVESEVTTLSPAQMVDVPFAERFVAVALAKFFTDVYWPTNLTPWPEVDPSKVLYFDIETHNEGKQWDMRPREFFRMGQYAWGPTGEVVLTTDYDEFRERVEQAEGLVGHNVHTFDLSVLFGRDSTRPLELAHEGRVFDTLVYANLALPAPRVFLTRDGKKVRTVDHEGKSMIGGVRKWLGLDNLCYQLGLSGKTEDLKGLAKKYNPPKTKVADLDYGLIPVEDPEFREYAVQDVRALQELTTALLIGKRPEPYDWREQTYAAINAQMTRNGFRVDVARAEARVQELAERKAALLKELEEKYDFPTEGAMPWRSAAGKEAIFKILADHGITPETHPHWTKTATGSPSLGGDALKELTEGTEAEWLGEALAELQGQRPLAQQALDYVKSDGYVHHDIAALQRSGRCSTTKPALTTWSAHGPKAVEKEYFIASPGRKLMEFDLSNADQRILAAISGDPEYAKRFEPGVDGHEINARIMFGDEVYESDPKFYRNQAKAPGHAWTYGAGSKKLAWTTGLPLETMERFAEGMAEKYPVLTDWQLAVRRAAETDGYTVNRWGRTMVVERDRAWTMTPALHGQSGTSEVLKDGLIRMLERDIRLIVWLVGSVHDAIVADIPEEHLAWASAAMIECMETEINGVAFPVEHGQPADDWFAAGH